MMRDNPGPRAVLNSLERLAGGYGDDIRYLKAEIALKEGQLRDYESRLGKPFQHENYHSQLADLRDRLKLGLSEKAPEGGTPTAELAEHIKALRASVTVEATPERVIRKTVRAERPVTARIRERRGEATEVKAVAEPIVPVKPATVVIPMSEPARMDYRHDVTRGRGDGRQMSLF